MKQIKNTIFLAITIVLFAACGSDDDSVNTDNSGSYINFSVSGQMMNGDYQIKENENEPFSEGIITGVIIHNSEVDGKYALMTFTDENQNLVVSLTTPAKKGTFTLDENNEDIVLMNIIDEEPSGIEGDYMLLMSTELTVSITEFETTTAGIFESVKKAKGSFNGVFLYLSATTGEEYAHTVTGDFNINKLLF